MCGCIMYTFNVKNNKGIKVFKCYEIVIIQKEKFEKCWYLLKLLEHYVKMLDGSSCML